MTSVRNSIIDFMRRTGMTVMFGNPGSTELPLYRDWPTDFRYILGLQESAVVSMADGYAQANGSAAIVNLHSAAGLGHAMGSLVTAYKNQTPLVITAGQQARNLLLAEPFLGATDAEMMPRPYVKWACEPASAADTPKALARAYAIAMTAPRGPVFVSIPVDDWDKPAELLPELSIHGAPVANSQTIEAAAVRIKSSKNPVIVAGPEIDRSNASTDAVALAEKLACPVWASPMSSRCSFPEDHRQFAGFLRADMASIAQALGDHDLIIVLGAPAFTLHFENPAPRPLEAPVLQFTNDPNAASYTARGTAIIGDVRDSLEGLIALTAAKEARAGSIRQPAAAPTGSGMTIAAVLDLLNRLRPVDALIAEEAPSARPEIQHRLRLNQPASFFATASGGLGFAASAAVGIALAKPHRRTIALLGDGSALYTIQALWTAAKENSPVTYVILNNGGYEALKGIARSWQTPSIGTDLSGLDFVSLSQGFGVPAARPKNLAELQKAFADAFATAGPSLIDVILDD